MNLRAQTLPDPLPADPLQVAEQFGRLAYAQWCDARRCHHGRYRRFRTNR